MAHQSISLSVINLASKHARDAAHLHMMGQPGTFLTALGADVLTTVYRALPETATGFGVAAVDDTARVWGFASATTSTGLLFANVALRYGSDLLLPLAVAALHNPALIGRMMATAAYPFQVARDEGIRAAELLSIMVSPDARGMGIGSTLLGALIALCTARNVRLLDVTVDAGNARARRFYAEHGFQLAQELKLYGRSMCQYIGAVPEDSTPTSCAFPNDRLTPTLGADLMKEAASA